MKTKAINLPHMPHLKGNGERLLNDKYYTTTTTTTTTTVAAAAAAAVATTTTNNNNNIYNKKIMINSKNNDEYLKRITHQCEKHCYQKRPKRDPQNNLT